jgi:hypothetical protein
MSQETLELIYFFYVDSIMNYGLFWGNSSYSNIFRLQRRIIRIITGARTGDSCRQIFKILKLFPRQSQYIPLLAVFVVNNKNQLKVNSAIHSINTRNNSNFFQPWTHLTMYQKGPYTTLVKKQSLYMPGMAQWVPGS